MKICPFSLFPATFIFRLKFSKEDHLEMIRLLWSVLHAPDMDSVLIMKTASALISLLKYKDTLTREDLSLEWRPLYDLYNQQTCSSFHGYPLLHQPR